VNDFYLFQYPFGNIGMGKLLRRCCKTDQDWQGLPLRAEANSCFNESGKKCCTKYSFAIESLLNNE
jgi:hypothetical protein